MALKTHVILKLPYDINNDTRQTLETAGFHFYMGYNCKDRAYKIYRRPVSQCKDYVYKMSTETENYLCKTCDKIVEQHVNSSGTVNMKEALKELRTYANSRPIAEHREWIKNWVKRNVIDNDDIPW